MAQKPNRRTPLEINRTRWDRTKWHAAGEGYWDRNGGEGYFRPMPTKVIWHTTNGKIGSSFEAEADWLARTARDVSAHYLVGKAGQCARILVPSMYIAWHVGATKNGWGNYESIGIECHYTPGEQWTNAMTNALLQLTIDLSIVYALPDLTTCVERHRAIAVPAGRKVDPSGMSDATFLRLRALAQHYRTA